MGKRVTDIQEFSKQKYSIYLDEEFAFVLYKGELSHYQIKLGEILEEEQYREIVEEVLTKRAKKRCLHLLKARSYTEKRLREKLQEGRYPSESIEAALAYSKSFGYLNDSAYAYQYILCHKESESRQRMREKLQAKGIAAELLEEVFAQIYTIGEEDELQLQQVRRCLQKKNYQPETLTWKDEQKLIACLMRKGISGKIIRQAMDEWEAED